MTFYINLFGDGATFEEGPAGDACQPVELSDRSSKAAAAVCSLESFELSQLLADVYLAGVRDGERSARTGCWPRVSAGAPPPDPAARTPDDAPTGGPGEHIPW
jgi:hypothetical protein